MIKVIAYQDRRRAGRHFPKGQAVLINPDDLKDEEQRAIMEDPMLNVLPVDPKDVPAQPELPADEKTKRLVAAIPALKDEQKNKDGSPNVRALSKVVGFDVTKVDIDTALKALEPPSGS